MSIAKRTGRGTWTTAGLAWEYGEGVERAMITGYFLGCILVVVPMLIEIALLAKSLPLGQWRQTALSVFPAAVAWPAYSGAIREVMYSPSCYRATVDEFDMTPEERDFVAEYAQFKDSAGGLKELRRIYHLGTIYVFIYFGMAVGAYPYVLIVYPHLGDWTALPFAGTAIGVAVVCWLEYRNAEKDLLRAATIRGFPLSALRKRLLESRFPRSRT